MLARKHLKGCHAGLDACPRVPFRVSGYEGIAGTTEI
jgi:hypothetical protein